MPAWYQTVHGMFIKLSWSLLPLVCHTRTDRLARVLQDYMVSG